MNSEAGDLEAQGSLASGIGPSGPWRLGCRFGVAFHI